MVNQPPTLLTASQLSQQINISSYTILKYARIGTIPCIRYGRKIVRFELNAVIKSLSQAESR